MPKLSLYYPVRPFRINQNFGENMPCVKDFGTPQQSIVNGSDNNSCPVGYDKLYPHFGMAGHNGTDLQAGEQSVYAACDGIVVEKQTVPARGLGIGILTNEQYDFGIQGTHFIKIRYWHLKSFNCEVGDAIKAGDLIGISDNTGYSSGNHLHFEGNLMDKDSGGHLIPFSPPGAIAGSIDVAPYFNGMYADILPTYTSYLRQLISLLTQELAILIRGRNISQTQ